MAKAVQKQKKSYIWFQTLTTAAVVGFLLVMLQPINFGAQTPSAANPSHYPPTANAYTERQAHPRAVPANPATLALQTATSSPADSAEAKKPAATANQPFRLPGSDHLNYPYQALLTPNDSLYPSQSYLPLINAPAGWGKTTGSSNQVIAIIDTGFSLSHPDLAGRWWNNSGEIGPTASEGPAPNCTSRGLALDKSCNNLDNDGDGYPSDWKGWDFVNSDNDPQAGSTNPGAAAAFHATFVAGVAAATGNNGAGVAGINWGARIMPLQALGDDGSGFTDTIANAINFAVNHGATVINLSLGSSFDDPYLHQKIDNAIAHGVTVVAAAGNDGCSCMSFPANYPEVIGVGASDQNDNKASFSSYGPNLDLVAPGATSICSTLWSQANPNGYGCGGQGTSFASPLVAGTVALMQSLSPGISPSEITRLLSLSADKVAGMGGTNFISTFGYGRLDVGNAVAAAGNPLPFGQILSKRTLSLSATTVNTGPAMDSTCIGLPAATCTITASLGSTTITLGSAVLDSNGNADFPWNAASQGLTSGTWSIKATMVYNGQTTISPIQTLQITN
jgi:subtilisin family serine protease